MGMRIQVDSTRCIGSGQCVLIAPHAFDQGNWPGGSNLREPPGGESIVPGGGPPVVQGLVPDVAGIHVSPLKSRCRASSRFMPCLAAVER
jgi:hypothetical protein